jgi:hypothetical protein
MLSSEQFDFKQSAVKEPKFMYGSLVLSLGATSLVERCY